MTDREILEVALCVVTRLWRARRALAALRPLLAEDFPDDVPVADLTPDDVNVSDAYLAAYKELCAILDGVDDDA